MFKFCLDQPTPNGSWVYGGDAPDDENGMMECIIASL